MSRRSTAVEEEADDESTMIELHRPESWMRRDLAFKYIPMASSASLTAFTSTVMDPALFFGQWRETVSYSLWISSCAGVSMWIYDRFFDGFWSLI